ncbi:MAG: Ig-like domain-containing protein, partial [Clostridia bacterium]|nr:Ig-like domain-containing protein [Clostridia bacterium]
SGTDPQNILLYPLESKTWTESGATWNNIGAHSDVSVAEATLENNGLASFDITNLVSWDWKGNAANAQPARDFYQEQGFLMVSADETAVKQVCSSEYTNTNLRPYVVMEYTAVLLIDGASSGVLCVEPSGKLQMSAKTYPSDCPITWSVSDEDVATIDAETGLLTGVSCGQVTVTATAITEDNVTFSGTMRVYVVPILPGEYYIESKQLYEYVYKDPVAHVERSYKERRFLGLSNTVLGMQYKEFCSKVTVQYYASGYYTIYVKDAEGYLSVPTSESGNVTVSATKSTRTRWYIEMTSLGEYKIESYYHSGLCLQNLNNASHALIGLSSYANDSNYTDEWIFHSGVFTIVNYYDSAFDDAEGNLEYIEAAGEFVEEAFKKLFNIDVAVKNEPILYQNLIYQQCPLGMDEPCGESCGSCNFINYDEIDSPVNAHHKNIGRIANQIMQEERGFNHIYVLWGDYDPSVFCSDRNDENEHRPLSSETVAVTFSVGNPFVQMLKILQGDTEEETKQLMSIALFHELFHVFGLSEQYTEYDHTVDDRPCVMSTVADLEVIDATTGQTKLEKIFETVYATIGYGPNNEEDALCDHCLGSFNAIDMDSVRFLDGKGWDIG